MFERLISIIQSRRDGDPATSYVASLFAQGVPKIAQKLGEEAVETAIAAVQHQREGTIKESADLLFHLLVLWEALGIAPQDVMQELARREGISGIEEKATR